MNLITLTDPRSPVSEAYRTLRTNLSFYSLDNPLRSLVVTSPASGDEKSVAVANLAVTMAQSGRRTVLVDCDLRRPSLHTFFNLSNDTGLTSMILNDDAKPPLQTTSVDNLWLLASGPKPPNPADLLGSRKIDQLIEALTAAYDVVLFDAPPVIAVTDAAVLGAKVDGVLLIISAGKSRRDHAERAKETLEKAKVRIIGVALTNAPKDSGMDGYYE
ncbi:MAG: CpsD/CapB family tyrosine-protein kinase [Chloroflexi bacterium]|nr:CpsD/CapB family tyrosine-protein kinase [Chloroflexota bacterium]MBK7177581.1 CpsD/CapB family tyrosine-protein kinase [Chloroflexota bacterium]MBK7920266.1 CpsD/CapB family tyrosine-protein kinase [Chloroflexota bacterium]MBK8934936.1 CpsD/CapB family tyrosine-protein kinase [Chloroflexota bacterium]MBP7593050.1 CpsD/CapB family tyrosine-protein kinase [Chloroflexota bacterium]